MRWWESMLNLEKSLSMSTILLFFRIFGMIKVVVLENVLLEYRLALVITLFWEGFYFLLWWRRTIALVNLIFLGNVFFLKDWFIFFFNNLTRLLLISFEICWVNIWKYRNLLLNHILCLISERSSLFILFLILILHKWRCHWQTLERINISGDCLRSIRDGKVFEQLGLGKPV